MNFNDLKKMNKLTVPQQNIIFVLLCILFYFWVEHSFENKRTSAVTCEVQVQEEVRINEQGLVKEFLPAVQMDCPMDVRECSDGSYVGRVAPKCDFKVCPE